MKTIWAILSALASLFVILSLPLNDTLKGVLVAVAVVVCLASPWWVGLIQEQRRKSHIRSLTDLSDEVKETLIHKRLAIGMTPRLVLLSWGKPMAIDQKKLTATAKKERWVYSYGRRWAVTSYVSFKDGVVDEVKTG